MRSLRSPDNAAYTRSRLIVAALAVDELPGARGRVRRAHPTVDKRRAGRDLKLVATDDDVQPDRLAKSELSPLDRAHLRLVEGLVRPERVLGPRVSAVLRSGSKIYIEALSFRAAELVPALFTAALKVAGQRGR